MILQPRECLKTGPANTTELSSVGTEVSCYSSRRENCHPDLPAAPPLPSPPTPPGPLSLIYHAP